MDETIILKLERLTVAFEKIASLLEQVVIQADRKNTLAEKKLTPPSEAEVARKAQKPHFTKIPIVVQVPRDGGETIKIRESEKGVFGLVNVKSVGYGFFTLFLNKAKLGEESWNKAISLLQISGATVPVAVYMSFKEGENGYKGRWVGNFYGLVGGGLKTSESVANSTSNAVAGVYEKKNEQTTYDDDEVPF